MDRPELLDRLPGERLRQRLPSVWSPRDGDDDSEDAEQEHEESAEWTAEPVETDAAAAEDEDENGGRLRTVLLGVSVLGAVMAVGAAVLRTLLGRGDDDSEDEDAQNVEAEAVESTPEESAESETERTPMDEGTAALLGLAFLSAVEALRDRLLHPTE